MPSTGNSHSTPFGSPPRPLPPRLHSHQWSPGRRRADGPDGLPSEGGLDRAVTEVGRELILEQDARGSIVSPHHFTDWAGRRRPFESLAAFHQGTANIRAPEHPDRYDGGFTSNTAAAWTCGCESVFERRRNSSLCLRMAFSRVGPCQEAPVQAT